MVSTELSTRIVVSSLTVIFFMGAFSIDFSYAKEASLLEKSQNKIKDATTTSTPSQPLQPPSSSLKHDETLVNPSNKEDLVEESSALDSPIALKSHENVAKARSISSDYEEAASTRLMSDSAEAGILLPYDEDFPQPGGRGEGSRRFPEEHIPAAVAFPARPIPLRISNGKAIDQTKSLQQDTTYSNNFDDDFSKQKTPTYFLRNSCFGPRCLIQSDLGSEAFYVNKKEGKSKKYEGVGRNSLSKYEDNVLESVTSNLHSQIAIPFMVYDDKKNSQQSSFSRRSGIADRFAKLTSTVSPTAPEGWVKLKAISPDTYDPFKISKNQTGDGQTTFSKRDSPTISSLTKRVGVELNPESFADRWGWSAGGPDNDNRRGGSRLPAWLEDQLKYGGNRNGDQDKNWVKLEPIPVAGVSISKWVPKGTPMKDLPTTNWNTNRDRPNEGSPWWDRIDDNRISSGGRPSLPSYLRPGGDDGGRFNGGGGWGSGGGGSGGGSNQGSSLSSFDRYPTNSWNDIIYPEGPQSATVSWQQSKGISNQQSSFAVGGGSNTGGWSASSSDRRRPVVATGSWSAPPPTNQRYPTLGGNRFIDQRPASSYPTRQTGGGGGGNLDPDDPRWVLISNTRRVTSGGPSGGGGQGNRGQDLWDRSKILQYINRLRPDLGSRDDQNSYPFESNNSPPSHHRRHEVGHHS